MLRPCEVSLTLSDQCNEHNGKHCWSNCRFVSVARLSIPLMRRSWAPLQPKAVAAMGWWLGKTAGFTAWALVARGQGGRAPSTDVLLPRYVVDRLRSVTQYQSAVLRPGV